jgi:hypothetical protein
MLFLAIAGLWAIWRGSITITESLSLEGRPARLYGATLLAAAVVLLLCSPLLARVTPETLRGNDAARLAVNVMITAALVVGLVFPFRRGTRAPSD